MTVAPMYKKYPGVEPTGVKRTFGLWDTGHMVCAVGGSRVARGGRGARARPGEGVVRSSGWGRRGGGCNLERGRARRGCGAGEIRVVVLSLRQLRRLGVIPLSTSCCRAASASHRECPSLSPARGRRITDGRPPGGGVAQVEYCHKYEVTGKQGAAPTGVDHIFVKHACFERKVRPPRGVPAVGGGQWAAVPAARDSREHVPPQWGAVPPREESREDGPGRNREGRNREGLDPHGSRSRHAAAPAGIRHLRGGRTRLAGIRPLTRPAGAAQGMYGEDGMDYGDNLFRSPPALLSRPLSRSPFVSRTLRPSPFLLLSFPLPHPHFSSSCCRHFDPSPLLFRYPLLLLPEPRPKFPLPPFVPPHGFAAPLAAPLALPFHALGLAAAARPRGRGASARAPRRAARIPGGPGAGTGPGLSCGVPRREDRRV